MYLGKYIRYVTITNISWWDSGQPLRPPKKRRLQTLESSLATKSEEEPLGFFDVYDFVTTVHYLHKVCVPYISLIICYIVVSNYFYILGANPSRSSRVILVGARCKLREHPNLDYISIYFPYAPCMVYLLTFIIHLSQM